VYFDTSYVAKFYLREAESDRVRELVRNADTIHSSAWTVAEFHSVLHRRVREGSASIDYARRLAALFLKDAQAGLWNLVPVREGLLRRTSALMVSAPQGHFYGPPTPSTSR
jgi:predicted nucleic acid-binding protein